MTTRDVYTMPQAGQVWRHNKSRNLYLIDHMGVHADTGGPEVSYYRLEEEAVYRANGPGAVLWYHRALEDFLRSVRVDSGGFEFRFSYVAAGTEELEERSKPVGSSDGV